MHARTYTHTHTHKHNCMIVQNAQTHTIHKITVALSHTKMCNSTHMQTHGYVCNLHAVNSRSQLHTARENFYDPLNAIFTQCYNMLMMLTVSKIFITSYITSTILQVLYSKWALVYYARFLPTYISLPLNIAQKVSHYTQ